ncbi:MAG: hypothetical protein K2L78_02375, partial [Muribaculaceae bacterium]|nr:hypothetical protein [Muribaculaceae bacterium]
SALNVIARKADGAMRDALSIFDQVAASSRGHITYQSTIDNLNVLDERYYSRLLDAFRSGNVPQALLVYKEVREHGFDSHFFINGLAQYLRDLMVARDPLTLALLDTDDSVKELMARQGAEMQPEFFYAAMSLCNDADLAYRQASSKTFLVELLLIKLCQLCGPSPGFSGDGEGLKLKGIAPAQPQGAATAPARPAASPVASPGTQGKEVISPSMPQQGVKAPSYPAVSQPGGVASEPPRPAGVPYPQGGMARRSAGSVRGHVSMAAAMQEKVAPAATVEQQAATLRRTPFSHDQLLAAWERYMAANPRAHLLVNTMRAHIPQPGGDASVPEIFVVTVVNPGQVELLNQEKPRLLQSVRDALGNDYFDFRIDVDENAAAPTAWSDRDVLNHMVERSPYLAQFITDFKFTLS